MPLLFISSPANETYRLGRDFRFHPPDYTVAPRLFGVYTPRDYNNLLSLRLIEIHVYPFLVVTGPYLRFLRLAYPDPRYRGPEFTSVLPRLPSSSSRKSNHALLHHDIFDCFPRDHSWNHIEQDEKFNCVRLK